MEENKLFDFGFEEFEEWFQCLIYRSMSEEEEDILYESKEVLYRNWKKTFNRR